MLVFAFRTPDTGAVATLALIPPLVGTLSVLLMGLGFFGALGLAGNDLSGFLPVDPRQYMPGSGEESPGNSR